MTEFSLASERTQRLVIGIVVAVVIVAAALFGIAESNDTPQNVFWAAVQNSMNTTALTMRTTEASSSSSEVVFSQLDFGQHPASRILTILKSDGAVAETETLTTTSAQYTRYDYIHKTVKGKPLNFSRVTGLWTKTASYEGDVIPPTFAETLLNQLLPVPMGNLTSGERNNLMQQIEDGQVYTINFATAKKVTYQGRPAYAYKVSIQPVLYLQLLKEYAPEMTMHQLDQLNANSYDGEAAVSATWTIDAKSKEFVKVDYGGGRTQTYSGWGVAITTPAPTKTVPVSELQKRLNAVL